LGALRWVGTPSSLGVFDGRLWLEIRIDGLEGAAITLQISLLLQSSRGWMNLDFTRDDSVGTSNVCLASSPSYVDAPTAHIIDWSVQ
jgi:hypothetical protein